jgi:hypothetical protein
MKDIQLPAPAKAALPCSDGSWLLKCQINDHITPAKNRFVSIIKIHPDGKPEELCCGKNGQYPVFGIDRRNYEPVWMTHHEYYDECKEEIEKWLVRTDQFASGQVAKNYVVFPTTCFGNKKGNENDVFIPTEYLTDFSPIKFLLKGFPGAASQPFLDPRYVDLKNNTQRDPRSVIFFNRKTFESVIIILPGLSDFQSVYDKRNKPGCYGHPKVSHACWNVEETVALVTIDDDYRAVLIDNPLI